jgi:ribosomal protein L37E
MGLGMVTVCPRCFGYHNGEVDTFCARCADETKNVGIWSCLDCGYSHETDYSGAPFYEHCKGCGTKHLITKDGYQKHSLNLVQSLARDLIERNPPQPPKDTEKEIEELKRKARRY